MTKKIDKINILTEGSVLVAVITVSAYLLVYCFELGYTKYFNIPSFLIEISLINIFITGGSLLFVYFLIFEIYNIFLMLIPTISNYVCRRILLANVPLLLILLGSFISYGKLYREQIILILLILFVNIFIYGFPLITQRKIKGYAKKLKAQDELEDKIDMENPTLSNKIIKLLPKEMIYFIFVLYVLTMIAYDNGKANAIKQSEFLVIKSNPEMVVLKKYNDSLITAKFNREDKTLSTKFNIINIAKNDEFELEKIGPLQVKD